MADFRHCSSQVAAIVRYLQAAALLGCHRTFKLLSCCEISQRTLEASFYPERVCPILPFLVWDLEN